MSTDQSDAYARLASYLEARADELDLEWVAVAKLANVSAQTVRAVRRGENEPSRGTKRGLDRAMQWEPGSVAAILAGGEPTPLNDLSPPTDRERLSDLLEQRRAELGLSWTQVAAVAGMSLGDLVKIRTGWMPEASERRGLEHALRWEPGSINAIFEGGDPANLVAKGRMGATPPRLQSQMHAEVEVDFGLGDTPPYPTPRDETEQELNETWQAAKNLEAIMRRQRKRQQHREIDEAG